MRLSGQGISPSSLSYDYTNSIDLDKGLILTAGYMVKINF
jgi:hypothetical protein